MCLVVSIPPKPSFRSKPPSSSCFCPLLQHHEMRAHSSSTSTTSVRWLTRSRQDGSLHAMGRGWCWGSLRSKKSNCVFNEVGRAWLGVGSGGQRPTTGDRGHQCWALPREYGDCMAGLSALGPLSQKYPSVNFCFSLPELHTYIKSVQLRIQACQGTCYNSWLWRRQIGEIE